ncbi:MAG: gluconate 2-dehydrogenase subunit 3 family protein [Flavobacteriaceae bacterium]|nr:gluconate 2-dehydrogenase subunit 3 family protein [Flavobacteriaceae bacterium]
MDRRESFKTMLLGSLGASLALQGCVDTTPPEVVEEALWKYTYGRTPKEQEFDEKLLCEEFFEEDELQQIETLANLILPPTEAGSIADANVVPFIEFMAKDVPEFQTKIKGGLVWLDIYCNAKYKLTFRSCTEAQQKEVLDLIAWPDPEAKEHPHEVQFFSLMRNLVLTGYFTSEVGIKELGYKGNEPNNWDGVPQDVLDAHGLSYDPEWLAKCVDPNTRGEIAQWDEEGNLIS